VETLDDMNISSVVGATSSSTPTPAILDPLKLMGYPNVLIYIKRILKATYDTFCFLSVSACRLQTAQQELYN
jgi:hypothetical protein